MHNALTKIYFISDLHLGAPDHDRSMVREKRVVSFLDSIKHNAKAVYLLGDVFDFWFEYKKVVPKGFVRFLGKLAELSDNGTEIHLFTGNHDYWYSSYFKEQLGAVIYKKPLRVTLQGKAFFLAHGDGLGPYDKMYKLMKSVITSKIAIWLFKRLHPSFSFAAAIKFSNMKRFEPEHESAEFFGEDKEWLVLFSKKMELTDSCNYYVFGHRHIAKVISLSDTAQCIFLGDWIHNFSYGELDQGRFELKHYTG